ncbi:hypothetical protein RclHR1_36590002 [Rhizophagus clarus]|uniref:Uncharacterized protein n=1 Tax=Rhizophagus clarus TaxID=94130 RepID=A0A2Z6RCH9_9GLOM|nr:hypothetical protein RclHR1_36590002 [Rhizophagus clarus]GES99919.1 hypothetical protein GLOIN_2v1547411 [Rhizophagus clarus]
MEIETAKLEFNTLKSKNFKIIEPFRKLCRENETLVTRMMKNIEDRSSENLVELCSSIKRVTSMMEQRNGITQDLFILTNRLLKKAENSEALRGYRDWISYFCKAMKKELGANVWTDVQFAVYRKIRGEKLNYVHSEQECISRLTKVLEDIDMSLQDFELLILMKIKSNKEFHGDELETVAQAKERLQKFPGEMTCFKEPLLKLFNACDIWDRQL